MKTAMQLIRVIGIFCGTLGLLSAADYIWLEGEAPTAKNADLFTAETVEQRHVLANEQWLMLSVAAADQGKIPVTGAEVSYTITAETSGKRDVWARLGMESIRAPFAWRLDAGEWQMVPALTQPYTDLMDTGFWSEVCWSKLGAVELTAGTHTLTFRVEAQSGADQKPVNTVWSLDCLCLSSGAFRPHGSSKPDAAWQTAADRAAAEHIYRFETAKDFRSAASLAGQWQVARFDEWEPADRAGPDKTVPAPGELFWTAITVPGDKNELRPDLRYAHRLVYRTRVEVPADLKNRAFILRIPRFNMIASVFVNGRFCGWSKAMNALWDCDVSSAITTGQVNEIEVVIKDTWYAISPKKSGKPFARSALMPYKNMMQNSTGQTLDFPVAEFSYSGLLDTAPSLIACGPVYASDVFAIPSVKKKALTLEVTLKNPWPEQAEAHVEISVEPLAGGASEKSFTARTATLAAGAESVLTFNEPWENPRLWWTDDPQQYVAVVTVSVPGRPVDETRTKFGFREWEWNSSQFKLNGVPWHGFSDCSTRKTAEEELAMYREHNQNLTVVGWNHGGYGPLWSYERQGEALDFFDKNGIVVQRQNMFNGRMADYLGGLADPVLFENYQTQLLAFMREDRNHPSIFLWQIDNEIIYINARNLGLTQTVDPLMGAVAKAAMKLDPTRPVTVGGGRCLVTEELPVNGCHYDEAALREYPDEAYTGALLAQSHTTQMTSLHTPWRLVPDRPIFHNEAFFLRGWRPSLFAGLGGEACFAGWESCRQGAGLYAKILSEGYRWQGVGAFQFWLGDDDIAPYYNSWKPVAALCREWNWTFAGGGIAERTLRIFNDTRFPEPITFTWELRVNTKKVGGEMRICKPAPGLAEEFKLTLSLPTVTDRTQGELVLSCVRNGREVFRDTKELWLLPADGGPRPALKAHELAVLDPLGTVKERLKKRGIAFTELSSGAEPPAEARVLVLGANALDSRAATESKWLSFAARGGRVLVLDQAHPLRFTALPADLEPTNLAGRVAFMENIEHPAFKGLGQPDFFTWSTDHQVYRNVYKKASRGARSLAHCDEELGYSCLSACEVNDGLMLLCQLLVCTKLGSDPVAERLFDNLLAYCADYRPLHKSAVVTLDPHSPRGSLLAAAELAAGTAPDPLTAIRAGKADIVVADATAASLQALADSAGEVTAFTRNGGWLFLWGVTPDGLADFNRLVGVQHAIRPYELERVTLANPRDPASLGLTDRDVIMESGEQIFPWAGGTYVINDEFNYIVDLEDVAPFADFPGARSGDFAAARAAVANWPRNVVNGFTSVDAWKLIHYLPTSAPTLSMKLQQPEELVELSLILNTHYSVATRVNLYCDDDPKPVSFEAKVADQRQTFAIVPPRRASAIRVELAEFNETSPTTGIDNLWLRAKRSEEWHQKVKPLLNIGGLVRYPQGQGGVFLCQIHIPTQEVVADNAQKRKNIVTSILKNIGATFANRKVVVAGAGLLYQPVGLNEACNLYLSRNNGWFSDERFDLNHFPVGAHKLSGVDYQVRDFKTSSLPVAIALSGPHLKAPLPETVVNIPVKRKADALFFLHTAKMTDQWSAPGAGDKTPPVIFTYVIHYADGTTAEAPVRYGEGVGNWRQKNPLGLPNATVAWAAPFPGDDSGEQAVVYQMQWVNPRPAIEIATLDVTYDTKSAHRYGVPVVLGISAATSHAH